MSQLVARGLAMAALFTAKAALATGFTYLSGSEKPLRVAGRGTTTCIQYPEFVVRSQPKAPAAGTVVVLRAPGGSPCGRPLSGKGQIPGREAAYFLGKSGNYLIFDIGTGPSARQLLLYDFRQARAVFEETYVGSIDVQDGILRFWSPARKQADAANCPQFDKIRSEGFNPSLQQRASVDLSTASLVRVDTSEVRCTAQQ